MPLTSRGVSVKNTEFSVEPKLGVVNETKVGSFLLNVRFPAAQSTTMTVGAVKLKGWSGEEKGQLVRVFARTEQALGTKHGRFLARRL